VPVAESLRNPDASLQVPLLLDKLRFAAGPDRVQTLDAQTLAEHFLGDSIYSNMVALGCAWQRGLVPVSLQALVRAIELNNVAVEANQLAFSLGRLVGGDPDAVEALSDPDARDTEAEDTLDALMAMAMRHLTAYQDAAYAQQFHDFVERVRERELQAGGDAALPLTRTVARSLLKLMAYKDEYEVARLYTDGAFQQSLREQFEGDFALEFYMAPPTLMRPRDHEPPRKIRLGPWMLPAMKLLAHGRRLRGTAFDFFGRTAERKLERDLIRAYRERIEALLPDLAPQRLKLACEIAALPLSMRGFGHVKLTQVTLARMREAELLHRFDPATYPRPQATREAGQIRGIRVTSATHG